MSQLFSNEIRQRIHQEFEGKQGRLGCRREEILEGLAQCSQEQRLCMEFLYATMPVSDLMNYDFPVFLSYVDHALFLRREDRHCAALPEAMFFDYVLYYRINNEAIEDCRREFYQLVTPFVEEWIGEHYPQSAQQPTMTQRALAVNYWCFTQATYQTTDGRTATPRTVNRCAYGRCGEESTFAVTALRSVGIPARQVYAPRWSHCDDNHAWVEVWCDGDWHYLGACEPEPVLDKGWFTAAASRAMLIHSRCFSQLGSEERIGQNGCVTVYNRTAHYAQTRTFTVTVTQNGQPLPDVTVNLRVLNYSEYCTIATLYTNEEGKVAITIGMGFLQVHARLGDRFVSVNTDTAQTGSLELDFAQAAQGQADALEGVSFQAVAPKDHLPQTTPMTQEQKDAARQDFNRCAQARHQKEAAYSQQRMELEGVSQELQQRVDQALLDARGNRGELETFLTAAKDREETRWRAELLAQLTKKDSTDLKAAVLERHLAAALPYREQVEESLFVPYLLNPRVELEELTDWRGAVDGFFPAEQKEAFRERPERIQEWIQEHCSFDASSAYGNLITQPEALLRGGDGSPLSQQILFVAICRTLGIPARLNPVDRAPQYHNGQRFVNVEKARAGEPTGVVRLLSEGDTKWDYYMNWTIARLKDGDYQTLDFTKSTFEKGELALTVPQGAYRLMTCSRMPTGTIFAREYRFQVVQGQETRLAIRLEQGKLTDLLEDIDLPDFNLTQQDGSAIAASQLTAGKSNVLVWLEESKEPTEHILNELMDLHQRYTQMDGQLVLILRSREALQDKTLSKALEKLPKAVVCYDLLQENVEPLARRMYLDPDRLPLAIATKPGLHAIYGCSGYNVGSADLLLKVLEAAR